MGKRKNAAPPRRHPISRKNLPAHGTPPLDRSGIVSPERWFQQAVEFHGSGNLTEAARSYQLVLRHVPDHTEAMNNLGMILHDQGQWSQAIALYRHALTLKPGFAEVMNNLGTVLHQQGVHEEAHDLFRAALQIRPEYVAARFNLALLLRDMKRPGEALAQLSHAMQHQPHHPEIRFLLGSLCQQLNQRAQAIQHYQSLLTLHPHHPRAHNNLGQLHLESGHTREAIDHLEKAVDLQPNLPEAWNNLGIAWDLHGERDRALAYCNRALQLNPNLSEAYNTCGNILQKQGKYNQAKDQYQEALRLRPDFVEAYCNLGGCLHQLGRLDEALAMLEHALSLCPDHPSSHYNESLIRLLQGDFALGWKKFEWRWQSRDFRAHGHAQPLWDGTPQPNSSLLIHCEQGFGDSIQFIRYLPRVRTQVKQIILLCPEPLVRLFRSLPGIDILNSRSDSIPPCDCQAPLMSLPYLLQTTPGTIPCPIPYLHADPALMQSFHDRMGSRDRLRIGLAWRGNPRQKNDGNRSMDFKTMARLFNIPGCTFFNLQKEADANDRLFFAEGNHTFDFTDELIDFAATAALITQLDLIISVDTSVIHLAGALGRPGWVLLTAVPDWRWLLKRPDSPWYPSLRLIRQTATGDWEGVINTVEEKLKSVLSGNATLIDP
ncbi:MAG: tetratricopeptide repeat protein [Magnetococcales bacterium]|nr:tetratricopeptide repeat protein [Magnetococcales bacterium]